MTFGLGICDDHSIGCMLAWGVLYAAEYFRWVVALSVGLTIATLNGNQR